VSSSSGRAGRTGNLSFGRKASRAHLKIDGAAGVHFEPRDLTPDARSKTHLFIVWTNLVVGQM
jgi:hypothetical protein